MKNIKIRLSVPASWWLGFVFFVSLTAPLSGSAYVDEGPVLWTSGGNILERYQSEVTGVLGGVTTAIAGVDGKFIVLKASPTKKEWILGVQDSGGTLRAYHSSDGVTWIADWTATVGDSNVARFDVAFEQNSGDAMIAYRSSNNNRFHYRYWTTNSGSWGGQQNQNTNYNSGATIASLRLAAQPASNNIGVVWISDVRAGSAGFWNGSSWSMWNTPITTNGTQYSGFSGTYPPMRLLDVAFMSQNGTMIAAMGQNDSSRMRYVTRTSVGAWSAVGSLSTLTGFGDYLRLEPSPSTNEVALTTCMMEPNSSQYLCEFSMWSGASWGGVTTDSTSGATVNGSIPTDVFWLLDTANSTRAAVAVYNDSTTGGIDWALSTGGGSFALQSVDSSAPAINAHEGEIISSVMLGLGNQADVAISDENSNIFFKRAILNNSSVTWQSVTGGGSAEITQGANLVSSSNFGRIGFAFQTTPPLLTIATSSASGVTVIGAGNTSYVANPTCNSVTTCTSLTLSARGKSDITVSSITLTQYGTASLANTSAWKIGIDTDGDPNDGVINTYTGVVTGSTITFAISPTLTIPKGTSVQVFPQATFGNGANYPTAGQTISLGLASSADINSSSSVTPDELITGPVRVNGIISPVITGYTNVTDGSLSYAAGCTACGSRLIGGAGAHVITIAGRGFGADPGAANRSTATNNISIGATRISNSNVTSWSNTSIGVTLNGSTVGNTDSDFGANYGGTNSLQVTSLGNLSSGVNFNLFPYVSGFTSPAGLGPSGAKVYASTDTDGVITLAGTRFGATQGSSTVILLGCSATTCVSPSDSVYVESWTSTSARVRVPATIPDTSYSGTVALVRASPSGAAVAARTSSATTSLNMRPRLISISPTSGGRNTSVTLSGRHLCPTSGVCPSSFSTSSQVVIAGLVATNFGGWTNTTITTQVPGSAAAGTTTAQVTAGGFNAGSVTFTVVIPIAAGDVTSLAQYSNATLSPAVPVGGYASGTTLYFGGVIESDGPGVLWTRLAVEIQPIGTAFVCGAGITAACLNARIVGGWKSGGGPFDCNQSAQNCAASTSTTDGSYHWQARTEFTNDSSWNYGNWISFPSTSTNAESAADFILNTLPPVISNLTVGDIDISSAKITWDTNKEADRLLQINQSGAFTNDCSAGNGCTGANGTLEVGHSVEVSGLQAGTVYYYRVRSCDSGGNCVWSNVEQFTTLSTARPAKTVFYHAITYGSSLASGASTTATFNVTIPETGTSFESIFLDLRGLSVSPGGSPSVMVTVNGVSQSYTLSSSAWATPWRLYHRLLSLNLTPGSNAIKITAGANTTLRSISGDLVITYRYSP
jgi:hypothetical protein